MNRTASKIATGPAILTLLALAANPAEARKADSFRDLNGSRAAGAESQLNARGLKYIDGRKGNYGEAYSYWWDDNGNDCIVVEVSDGKVMTINDADKKDCNHSGSNAGAAVAAVAGVAILGALLAHKSDQHEDKKHHQDEEYERQYDRGYTDGLYHHTYHNPDRTDGYSNGYTAGVQQRTNNSSYRHDYNDNRRNAAFGDLDGARASSADSTLRQRGFRNVDGFKSGSTAYTIWNRPSSNQCLQMTVANGRVEDIRDIGRHPKCN